MKKKQRVAACLIALGLGILGGCSISVALEPEGQCQRDEDCWARGGLFASSRCEQQVCRAVKLLGHDAETVEKQPTACQRDQDCATSSGPGLCLAGQCQPLTSAQCARVLAPPSLALGGSVRIGAIINSGHQTLGSYQEEMIRAMHLAIDELNESSNGGLPVGGDRRSLVGVVCDEGKEQRVEDAFDAAKHLFVQLGSPFVMGPSSPPNLLSVFNNVAAPARKLLLAVPEGAGINVGVQIADEPRSVNALGSCTDSDRSKVKPALGALRHMAEKLKNPGDTGPFKVAIVVEKSPNGESFYKALSKAQVAWPVLNGLTFAENVEQGHVVPFEMPYATEDGFGTSYVKDIVAMRPDLVFYGPAIGMFHAGVKEIEDIYDSLEKQISVERPHYLGITYDDVVFTRAKARPDLLPRTRFLQRPLDLEIWKKYAQRYRDKFGQDARVVTSDLYECTYLSTYTLLAAIKATQKMPEAIVADDFLQAHGRFQSAAGAVSHTIGPDFARNVLEDLANSQAPMSLRGLHGTIALDEQGFPDYPLVELQCATLDPVYEETFYKPSGAAFDASTGQISGQDTCP